MLDWVLNTPLKLFKLATVRRCSKELKKKNLRKCTLTKTPFHKITVSRSKTLFKKKLRHIRGGAHFTCLKHATLMTTDYQMTASFS